MIQVTICKMGNAAFTRNKKCALTIQSGETTFIKFPPMFPVSIQICMVLIGSNPNVLIGWHYVSQLVVMEQFLLVSLYTNEEITTQLCNSDCME